MKRLTIILGMLGMFAVGCATASVLIDSAQATPAAGSQQCAAFEVPSVGKQDVEKNKHEEVGVWLPVGWTPVGVGMGGIAVVVACRTAP
jgi:hypothetical protein